MTGSVHAKKGYWYIVLQFKGKDNVHKTKWTKTGFKSKGNKKKAEALIGQAIEKFKYLECDEHNIRFDDYLSEWLSEKKISIRQSTWETYEMYIRTHISPYFSRKNTAIKDITARDVKDFYMSLTKDGANKNTNKALCTRSIRKIASLLKTILNDAVAVDIISKNPAAQVKPPKQPGEEDFKGSFLTLPEAQQLLKAFKGHELEPVVMLTLYYGLRRSEVVGLKWDAVDFENNTFKIQHTVVNVSTVIASDDTKTASSRREFQMMPEVREMLLELKQKQEKNKNLCGDSYFDSGYVFTWIDGTPFRPDSVSRGFKRVLVSHNVPVIRFHDLRHTTASILYDKGWPLKDIQEWLRHADIETTANIYTHISNERTRLMSESLTGMFSI